MMIDSKSFEGLVDLALKTGQYNHMRPVVEKELLHYDILFCLDSQGLLDNLVFQGGTSLRLCHGGSRFSEDLDFAGGVDFSAAKLAKMKECIEDYIGGRYNLEVTVKEPKILKEDPKYAELRIDKWQIAVTTAPQRKELPMQKIKIEVANVPAHTQEPKTLIKNYDFLPDGYDQLLVPTETLDEIMADKIISLSATTKYVRYRDIWDLAWLDQQGAKLNAELVKNKVQDYKIVNFGAMLQDRIQALPENINDGKFETEMRRFLPADVFSRTLALEKFRVYIQNTLLTLNQNTADRLVGNLKSSGFRM